MSIDRLGKNNIRQRRMFQRLSAGQGFNFTGGLDIDADSNVTIKIVANEPLTATAAGLALTTGNGLTGTTTLSVSLASPAGLEFTGGALRVLLATGAPFQIASGLDLVVDGTLTVTTGTLGVTSPEGEFTVTAKQTGTISAAIGQVVLADVSSGVATVNLPAVSAANAGRQIVVKDSDSNAATNNITIDGNGGETIDGSATLVLSTDGESARLVSDGSAGWYRI